MKDSNFRRLNQKGHETSVTGQVNKCIMAPKISLSRTGLPLGRKFPSKRKCWQLEGKKEGNENLKEIGRKFDDEVRNLKEM